MPYLIPADMEQLVKSRMATGNYGSEAEVLRHALEALAEQEDDLAAIQDALAELAAGDPGQPLEEAFREIRERGQSESAT